jgi:phage regulator Rha-like protein
MPKNQKNVNTCLSVVESKGMKCHIRSDSKPLEITLNDVDGKIITLRNQLVLLDRDVAALYDVQTKEINQAVKNNPRKFPQGYVFELDEKEAAHLRSKKLTANLTMSRVPPKAFAEKGLYMLATILKGDKAIDATLEIIEAFARMRAMSRSIVELMKDHENKQKQKEMVTKGEELFDGIISDALETVSTETSFELNLAAFKIKHTVKRSRKITQEPQGR